MSNMPKLSSRAQKALDVLTDGGRFVHRLERNNYTGRDQFQYRVMPRGASWSNFIKGISLSAFYELQNAGFLSLTSEGTSVSTYYKLNTVA